MAVLVEHGNEYCNSASFEQLLFRYGVLLHLAQEGQRRHYQLISDTTPQHQETTMSVLESVRTAVNQCVCVRTSGSWM